MGDLCLEPSREVAKRLHRIRRKGVHDGAEWRPRIGKNQLWRKLQKRNRHESSGSDVWMGQGYPARGEYLVAMEKKIQVQGPRRVRIVGALPAQRELDPP